MPVALATCLRPPEADPDEELMLDALRAAGLDARMVAWDDPGADFGAFDLCVIRSTWNYAQNVDAYRAWLERTAAVTRLYNPLAMVRGNLHKRYLLDLDAAVVPTALFARGAPARLADLGWDDVVVKPAISAGSWRTRRFEKEGAGAQAFLDELLRHGDALVQPHVGGGELAVVSIDGERTHAVSKEPRFADDAETVSEARAVPPALGAVAARLLPPDHLYGRVDFLREPDGPWLVSEVELVEPSLFLAQHPPALSRLARAVARRGSA